MAAVTTQLPSAYCLVHTTRQRGSLDHVVKRIQQNSRHATRRWATVTKASVRKLAPVDTGFMKSMVKSERHGDMDWEVYVDGNLITDSGAFYAIYVEHGTRYQRAQPFFWPSVNMGHGVFTYLMINVYKNRAML
jgi:HK97 gp10 family phage protein